MPPPDGPVRPLPSTPVRAGVIFAALLLTAVAFGFIAGGKGWRALGATQRLSLLAPLVLLAALSSWELAQRMIPGALIRVPAVASGMAAIVFATAWTLIATPHDEPQRLFYPICVVFTAVGAGLTAVAVSFWLRRGLMTEPSTRWVLAAAFGLAGFLAVELFCPYIDAAHILTSHALPGVAAGSIAAVVSFRRQ